MLPCSEYIMNILIICKFECVWNVSVSFFVSDLSVPSVRLAAERHRLVWERDRKGRRGRNRLSTAEYRRETHRTEQKCALKLVFFRKLRKDGDNPTIDGLGKYWKKSSPSFGRCSWRPDLHPFLHCRRIESEWIDDLQFAYFDSELTETLLGGRSLSTGPTFVLE